MPNPKSARRILEEFYNDNDSDITIGVKIDLALSSLCSLLVEKMEKEKAIPEEDIDMEGNLICLPLTKEQIGFLKGLQKAIEIIKHNLSEE